MLGFTAEPPVPALAQVALPVPEAVNVEDVAAVELLVAGAGLHVLAADDADVVAAGQVLRARVGEALVHVGRHPPVAQEVGHPVAEVAERPVQVPHLRGDTHTKS